jgi:hypothetical protein
VQKQELQDKGLKSEKILKEEEAVKAEKSLLDRNEKMGEKIGEKKDKAGERDANKKQNVSPAPFRCAAGNDRRRPWPSYPRSVYF